MSPIFFRHVGKISWSRPKHIDANKRTHEADTRVYYSIRISIGDKTACWLIPHKFSPIGGFSQQLLNDKSKRRKISLEEASLRVTELVAEANENSDVNIFESTINGKNVPADLWMQLIYQTYVKVKDFGREKRTVYKPSQRVKASLGTLFSESGFSLRKLTADDLAERADVENAKRIIAESESELEGTETGTDEEEDALNARITEQKRIQALIKQEAKGPVTEIKGEVKKPAPFGSTPSERAIQKQMVIDILKKEKMTTEEINAEQDRIREEYIKMFADGMKADKEAEERKKREELKKARTSTDMKKNEASTDNKEQSLQQITESVVPEETTDSKKEEGPPDNTSNT